MTALNPEDRALIELKPCPFCGPGGDLVFSQPCTDGGWGVTCRKCHTNMDVRVTTKAVAASFWNTRTEGRHSGEGGDRPYTKWTGDLIDALRVLARPDKGVVYAVDAGRTHFEIHGENARQVYYLVRHAGEIADEVEQRVLAPFVEAKPAEGEGEAHVAQIILGMMVPTDCFQTAEMRQRALATAKRLLAMTTREAVPARDEAALPEGWVAVPREPTEEMMDAADEPFHREIQAQTAECKKHGGPIGYGSGPVTDAVWKAMLAAVPQANPATGTDELPADVVRLVIAARKVAFEDTVVAADLDGAAALKALDAASEAFADRVGWEDEPDRAPLNEGDGR